MAESVVQYMLNIVTFANKQRREPRGSRQLPRDALDEVGNATALSGLGVLAVMRKNQEAAHRLDAFPDDFCPLLLLTTAV